jgi:penicillin-binding protein 2
VPLKRNSISKRLFALCLLGTLLVACTSTAQPTPTVTAPPSPTVILPTATATLTPENAAATAYLAAWEKGDYAAMYARLTPESQAALSAADFEKQYRDNLDILTATAIKTEVKSVSNTGADSAQAQAHLAYTTFLIGTLETDITLDLKHTGSAWRVAYSPALIWPELINGQKLYMAPLTPDRGAIYDRNGVPMVNDTDAYAIGLVPGEISNEGAVQSGLGRLLNVPGEQIQAKYAGAAPDQYLAMAEMSSAEVGAGFDYLLNVAGLKWSPYTSRFYYGNGAGAHITGYTIFIPPDQIAAYRAKGYSIDQRVGATGLEGWGEEMLAGRNGGQLVLLDANNGVLETIASGPFTPAQDIYSTVDFELQKDLQFALGDLTGAAVVLNMQTGEVLAMASSPTYDPNQFDGANINQQFIPPDKGINDPRQPLINRAAQSSYPAGSVFKVLTMSAGMTSGLFTPDSEYACVGVWEEAGPTAILNDWKEGGHGKLTLKEGLSASCNPYFWHVGYALFNFDPGYLSNTARAFGLGQATGIEQIAETPGQIPDPDSKLKTKGEPWEPLDSLNLAIGQGDVLVTPLQIARMMAAIGNGGTLYKPQLVLTVRPPAGEPTFELKPLAVGKLPLSAEQLAALQEAMHNVTLGPIGTARNRFRGLKIPVAGKTGTAEDPGTFGVQEPDAWFAGYTFANQPDKPDIAIAVVVSNQGQGSDYAAPIFRRIVESYFGLNFIRYPWESAVGVPALPSPTPTATSEFPVETETPQP